MLIVKSRDGKKQDVFNGRLRFYPIDDEPGMFEMYVGSTKISTVREDGIEKISNWLNRRLKDITVEAPGCMDIVDLSMILGECPPTVLKIINFDKIPRLGPGDQIINRTNKTRATVLAVYKPGLHVDYTIQYKTYIQGTSYTEVFTERALWTTYEDDSLITPGDKYYNLCNVSHADVEKDFDVEYLRSES